jgi:hypothetical protein
MVPMVMETPRKTPKTTKLTGDRAARKREQDRQAQRSAREKTRQKIAALEDRIETLTRFHSSGNIHELIEELDAQRKANEALRATLRSIEKAISGGLAEASMLPAYSRLNLTNFTFYQTLRSKATTRGSRASTLGSSPPTDRFLPTAKTASLSGPTVLLEKSRNSQAWEDSASNIMSPLSPQARHLKGRLSSTNTRRMART